jgi:hypothetical protein
MGNRIHTVLGYGLKDVVPRKDKRINDSFWKKMDDEVDFFSEMKNKNEEALKADPYNFDATLFKHRIEGIGWHKGDTPFNSLNVSDILKSSGYFYEMKKGPIVFTDLSPDWYRYDDTIDYYVFRNPKDSVKLIKNQKGESCGIYPYHSYVNKKTGERIKCSPSERWSGNDDYLSQKYNLTLEEWKTCIVPEVPYIIKMFCEVADIFVNPLDVYDLKAMVYTYWS